MSSWINFSAIWKIVVFGLLAGAGLPALFAIGMTTLSRGARSSRGATATAGTGGPGGGNDVLVGGSVIGMMIAAVCFLVVLAAIGWGIFEIYQSGHPAK
ncbi:MAG TPA: hypothetical protein VHZ03_08115 [Trebonia sp.]|jgi:hypothetical protein|nr:hypothetical protein [Trebonia sp.]